MDEVKAPTKTERPPSIVQKQGVSSNRKRGRRAKSPKSNAGCLRSRLSWLQVRHETESWKCEEGTGRQPSLKAQHSSKAGRLQHTSRWGRRYGVNQDGKTTKCTAMARGHSNPKRGRQGKRHTVSIAGCYRSCCIDSWSGMLTESWMCEEGTVRQPSLKHSKRPMQEGSNLRPGEG